MGERHSMAKAVILTIAVCMPIAVCKGGGNPPSGSNPLSGGVHGVRGGVGSGGDELAMAAAR